MKSSYYLGKFEAPGCLDPGSPNKRRYNLLLNQKGGTYTVLSLGLIELEDWLFCKFRKSKYIPISVIKKLNPILVFGDGGKFGGAWFGGGVGTWTDRPKIVKEDYTFFATLYPEYNISPEMFHQLVWFDFRRYLHLPSINVIKNTIETQLSFKGNFTYYDF